MKIPYLDHGRVTKNNHTVQSAWSNEYFPNLSHVYTDFATVGQVAS